MKSLRIVTDPLLGQRAEAYRRFPSSAQNVLKYRTLQSGCGGRGWIGDRGSRSLYQGSDPSNLPVSCAFADGHGSQARIELGLGVGSAPRSKPTGSGPAAERAVACGIGDTTAYVACDGPYLVHVADPGINPPNWPRSRSRRRHLPRGGTRPSRRPNSGWMTSGSTTRSRTSGTPWRSTRLQAADVARSGRLRAPDGLSSRSGDPTVPTTGAMQVGMGLSSKIPAGFAGDHLAGNGHTVGRTWIHSLSQAPTSGHGSRGPRTPCWTATYALSGGPGGDDLLERAWWIRSH
jgi:hypothetical protein